MKIIGNTIFLYVTVGNMYAVPTVSPGNAQAALAFQFLHELVKVLKSYFGDFTEESIRNNFVLIYELLDEVLDYGYPQNCSTDVLKMYITQQGDKSAADLKAQAQAVTIQATGAISAQGGDQVPEERVSSSTSSRTATCSCRTRGRSCATT